METIGQFIDAVLAKSREKQIEFRAIYFRESEVPGIPNVMELEWRLGNRTYAHMFGENELDRRIRSGCDEFADFLTSMARSELQQLIANARQDAAASSVAESPRS